MSTAKTRKNSHVILFGPVKDINPECANVLPTYEDVLRCFASVRLQLKGDGSKQPLSSTVANIVAEKLEKIWQRASLPTISRPRIKDMILNYNTKHQTIIKPIKSRVSPGLQIKLSKFKSDSQRLFDICLCKCDSKLMCKCNKLNKIAESEWQFITDQRTERKMMIGNIDKAATLKLMKKMIDKTKANLL